MKNQFGLKHLFFCILLLAVGMAMLKFVFDPSAEKYTATGVKWRTMVGVLAGVFLAAGIAGPVGWMGAAKKIVGSTAFIVCFVTGALCTVHLSEYAALGLPRQGVYGALDPGSGPAEYSLWGMIAAPIAAGLMAWLMVKWTTRRTPEVRPQARPDDAS